VKAVILEMPEEWLDERHRLDLDRKDEMWEGVLHVVPPASSSHNEVGADLLGVFHRYAAARGLRRFVEPGVFDPAVPGMTSYRVADLGFALPEHVTTRGIEGRAALLVEILSPSDESYEKLPFYRGVGVEELLYVNPATRAFEVRRPDADGWLVAGADHEGWVGLVSLGLGLRTAKARLQVRTPDGIEQL